MKKYFVFLLLFLQACGPAVTTRVVDPASSLSQYRQDITTSSHFSSQTEQAIRLANSNPDEALERGEEFLNDPLFHKFTTTVERTYVGAEISLGRAIELEKSKSDLAIGYFLKAAQFATEGALSPDCASPFDIRCDGFKAFYSRALIGLLNSFTKNSWQPLNAPPDGASQPTTYVLSLATGTSLEQPSQYDFLQSSASIDLEGLPNRYHRWGVGLALTACRKKNKDSPADSFLPKEGLCLPLTALLKFDKERCTNENCSVTFGLRNALKSESFTTAAGRTAPLQADFTAPFATVLERSGIGVWDGLFSAFSSGNDQLLKKTGFYTVEPYDPDKIPLITVHGLFSSPATWLSLHNDLMGDELLRRHFQVWHYLYPTNLPILMNAKTFRDKLDEVDKFRKDHGGVNGTQAGMVVIAHSMGGLLTKTASSSCGDTLKKIVLVSPDRAKELDADTQKEINDYFEFQSKTFIDRVIFVAVPHRGSIISDDIIGRIGRWLIHLPLTIVSQTKGLLDKAKTVLNPKFANDFANDGDYTSVKGLSPSNPVLQGLANIAVDQHIPFHSIIGDQGKGGGLNASDGVVAYTSAHLEGAQSELIVPAAHDAHTHPLAVREIRRILHLHLEEREKKAEATALNAPKTTKLTRSKTAVPAAALKK